MRAAMGAMAAAVATLLVACSLTNAPDDVLPAGGGPAGGSGAGSVGGASSGSGGSGASSSGGAAANGQPCSDALQCASGHCPAEDDLCCDSACDGSCVGCSADVTGESDGTCAPILAGTDPASECPDEGPGSCGADGSGCNGDAGAPGCRLYPAGNACASGSCANGIGVGESLCDGLGSCEPGAGAPCSPYVCNSGATACLTQCTTGADCEVGYSCVGATCGVLTTWGNDVEFPDASSHSANFLLGSRINVPVSFTLTHLAVISKSNAAQVKLGLYSDVGGEPGNLLASTPATQLIVGPMELPVTNQALPAGDYWFMAVYSTSAQVGFDTTDPGAVVKYISLPFTSALPPSFGAATTYSGQRFNYYIMGVP